MKIAINIRPKDDILMFLYDEDQVSYPPISRIYGSDKRKLSQVNDMSKHQFIQKCTQPFQITESLLKFSRFERVTPSMDITCIMRFSELNIWIMTWKKTDATIEILSSHLL